MGEQDAYSRSRTARRRPRLDIGAALRLTELADYIVPFAIRVVCDLGIADLLVDGPRSVADLARRTGTHAPALARVLRALTCKGIFVEIEPDSYELTPIGDLLRNDHPFSVCGAYPLLRADLQAWGRLEHSIRTGESGFEHVHGATYYDYLAEYPEESARVDRSVESTNPVLVRTLLPAYPWERLRSVVDVGSGNGAFLAGLLARHRAMRGVLFDRSHVLDGAPRVLAQAGVAERCELVPGDYFDAVPEGADAYLLKTILHDWKDEPACEILRSVRRAMRPDSRVLVVEPLFAAGDQFDFGKLMDVHSLVMSGGRDRTEEEYAELMAKAGLALVKTYGSSHALHILDAQSTA